MKLAKPPIKKYIDEFDQKHIDLSYNDYWLIAKKQNPLVWNSLFLKEIQFRANNYRNLVFSVEGEQGTGKSAGLIRILDILGQFFNPFKVDNVYFYQEEFSEALRNYNVKDSFALDEQPRLHGAMSGLLSDQLANFEDIYRKPQVNIGYASPSLRTHEHFFIFESIDEIELNEDGSPSSVCLMLKTKRQSDKLIMPRGILKFSWVKPEIWKAYEKRKDAFIQSAKNRENKRFELIEAGSERVIKKFFEKLYSKKRDGSFKLISRATLDFYIMKTENMNDYTSQGLGYLRESIRQKVMDRLQKR